MKNKEQSKASGGNYAGCAVLLFDDEGNTIGSTRVTHNDNEMLRMQVQVMPSELDVGSTCRLLVFTDPLPCEYQGKIVVDGVKKVIALYQGRTRDKRSEHRAAIAVPAQIESLTYSGKDYPLHTPIKVTLVNVSKGGMRFSAPSDTSTVGNKFKARVSISNTEKIVSAQVVNLVNHETKPSQYGCRFLSNEKEENSNE